MRYRPFGNSGMTVSAVSLRLSDDAARARGGTKALIHGALQAGVNCFELDGGSPALLAAIGEALSAVARRLVFVSWRLDGREQGLTAYTLAARLGPLIERAELDYLDLLTLHEPAGEVSLEALSELKDLQETGLVRRLGVAGDGEAIDGYIDTGAFDALSASYNLNSGWAERNRLKRAAARDMAVIGRDVWPRSLREMKIEQPGRRGLFRNRAEPLKGMGGYHFLEGTPGWTAEEICLAYALTEPAIATVQVEGTDLDRIRRLADTPERDLPTGVAAQIEMARFSPGRSGAA